MKYISVKDAARLFEVTPRRVQQMCMDGRIPGAIRISNVWLVPEGVKRPKDLRKKEDTSAGIMNLKELCDFLKISHATGRNWMKSGRIYASFEEGKTPYFTKEDAVKLKERLLSEDSDLLRSRRNKRYKKGATLYKDYIKTDSPNFKVVKGVIEYFFEEEMELSEKEIRWVLADCGLKIMRQVYGGFDERAKDHENPGLSMYLDGKLSFGDYDKLFDELLSKTRGVKTFIKSNAKIFNASYTFCQKEDLLGFLYMSCKNIRGRKAKGLYYTPASIVTKVVETTFAGSNLEYSRILEMIIPKLIQFNDCKRAVA